MSSAENFIPFRDLTANRRLKIGDLARICNKSARALRLYEGMGLLGAQRTEGGHRFYSDDALVRLTWIDKLQALGFSLPRIRELLDGMHDASTAPQAMDRIRSIYREKLEETRMQIHVLETLAHELEESLRYLDGCQSCDPHHLIAACAACEQPHVVEPPTLISGMHHAGEGGEPA